MKLDYRKTIFVGLAFFIICMFWQVYDNIIAKMLVNSFGLNQFASGIVLALDNVIALFLLPLFGMLSDKTKNKRGKRTPFIFWGVILSAILFVGVAVIDSYQQKANEEANVPHVVEVKEGDSVLGYIVGDEEFMGEDYENLFAAKNEAFLYYQSLARTVSKQHNGYLISFIALLFVVLLVMAMYRTPAVSLMPDVTPKPLRSKANAIINLMGTVGAIIALGFMSFTAKDYHSYILTFVILGILMIGFLVLFLLTVNETKMNQEFLEKYGEEEEEELEVNGKMAKDVKKSFILILLSVVFWFMAYNAATSKFSVYSGLVLNTLFTTPLIVAQAVAVISYIPIGFLAGKIGRKKTVLIGVGTLFIAFLLAAFLTENSRGLIYVAMGFAGLGWATINVNSYPMVVEMSRSSNIGKYTGYYYTASMAAQIITPLLSGALIDGSIISGINIRGLFPYCSVFAALAFITMLFVKHGDVHEPRKVKENV